MTAALQAVTYLPLNSAALRALLGLNREAAEQRRRRPPPSRASSYASLEAAAQSRAHRASLAAPAPAQAAAQAAPAQATANLEPSTHVLSLPSRPTLPVLLSVYTPELSSLSLSSLSSSLPLYEYQLSAGPRDPLRFATIQLYWMSKK